MKLCKLWIYCFSCSGGSWISFLMKKVLGAFLLMTWVGCHDRSTSFLPRLGNEIISHIPLHLGGFRYGFRYPQWSSTNICHRRNWDPAEKYKLKRQAELLLSTKPCPSIPPLSVSLSLYMHVCIYIFYYPLKICDLLMFCLYTCGHIQVSVRPRHIQNHSIDFCMEWLRIEPIP